MDNLLKSLEPISYAGKKTNVPYAYRYYDPKKIILGKTMQEHLRLSVSYWHTYSWLQQKNDTWTGNEDALQLAKLRVNIAFEFIQKLGLPFFSFSDDDLIPEARNLRESAYYLEIISDLILQEMEQSKIKLLWGTSNLANHPRYQEGAATNPNPHIFSYAAAEVKLALDITQKLGGKNYLLWNACEGYETLLNTDINKELDQLGRFLSMLVEYKNKIGFKGNLLIDPRLYQSSARHQDTTTANIFAFLHRYNLEKEFKVNLQINQYNLSTHTLPYEIAYGIMNNLIGSIDVNNSQQKNSWDTEQLPSHLSELVQIFYLILNNPGEMTGGFNCDNKKHFNLSLTDLLYGHVSTVDTLAHALILAAELVDTKKIAKAIETRYSEWTSPLGTAILEGKTDFETLANSLILKS